MSTPESSRKRIQFISVTLIYGLGLLCVLHFAWMAILDISDLLRDQKGQITFSYGRPLSFFRTQYKTRYVSILRSSIIQPDYRERMMEGIQVDGPYNALVELELALGLGKRNSQSRSLFTRSDFVIGIIVPGGFILFSLLMHCSAISKGTFLWWETVICIVVVVILLAILMPIGARPHHPSDYTYQTWKALTLPAGAVVLEEKKDNVNNPHAVFVLYKLPPAIQVAYIFSSDGNSLVAEGGDYVIAAIADGRDSYRSLAVNSAVVPPFPMKSKVINPKLKILQRLSNAKNDSVILEVGNGLPKLRYDFRKFTLTTLQK